MKEFRNELTLFKEDFIDAETWLEVCNQAGFDEDDALGKNTLKVVWSISSIADWQDE